MMHSAPSAGSVTRGDGRSNLPPVGPAAFLTAVYGLTYLFWERSGFGGPALRDLISNAGFMPLNLLMAGLCLLASQRAVLDPGVRRALRLMGIGSLLVFIGNAISVYHVLVLHDSPAVSWADLFYLTDSSLLLVALFAFPLTRRIHLEWWKFVLDAAMVLMGGGVVIWYFTVRPGAPGLPDHWGAVVLTFAYPLASMMVLLGITTVLLRRPIDRNRWAFGLLVAGVLMSVIGDLLLGLVRIETGERGASLVDSFYLMVYLLLIASAELYYRRPVPRTQVTDEQAADLQPISPLPYLAVAVTFALLLFEAFRPGRGPVTPLAVAALVITVLVVARQLLAVRQNVRLLAETSARQNEARFRSLVQHSSDVIIVTDAEATIRFVSPSASRVLRLEPARITGLPMLSLLAPEDRERAQDVLPGRLPEFRRHAAGGVGVPAARRLRAADRDDRHQPARRRHRPRGRAEHPGRQRPEAPGAGAPSPGLPRLADRARQPRPLPRPREPRADAGPAAGPVDQRPVPRPRRLQAGQRQPRPHRRATGSWWRPPSGSWPAPGPPTRSLASAATNSPSWSRT